jgi:hypothetical protein
MLTLPRSFVVTPGAAATVIATAEAALRCALPTGLRELYARTNGGEGFIGENYLRIYPVDRLPQLNVAFGVAEFAPELRIFGSNGGGEAFALVVGGAPRFVQVPFIPMVHQYARDLGFDLEEFLARLRGGAGDDWSPSPEHVGMEVHEIQPIVFGGDPRDRANKALLPTAEYAPVVMWWNRKYREVTQQRKT